MKYFIKSKVSKKRWHIAQIAEKEYLTKYNLDEIIKYREGRYKRYIQFLERTVNLNLKDHKILDIGCKQYGLINFINAKERYGIDPLVDPCLTEFKSNKIRYIKGTGEFLPFHSMCFDMVLCTNVIDHMMNPFFCLNEVNRILKNNGLFILSVHTFSPSYKIFKYIRELLGDIDLPHPFAFTRKEVEKLINDTGFNIQASTEFYSTPGHKGENTLRILLNIIWNWILFPIDKLLDNRIHYYSEDLLAVCKKKMN